MGNATNFDSDESPQPGDDPEFVMERLGKLHDTDRSFDIEYWQRQGPSAIFDAAWELVELYLRQRSAEPHEFRLQRTIEHIQRS